MNLPVAVVLAVVGTLLIMLIVRGKRTPAPVTAGIFGLVVVSLVIGGWSYSNGQSSNRATDRREAASATASAAQRAYDAQLSQYTSCVTKVGTRLDIRSVLFSMVDLSDLFPGNTSAEQYTSTRQALIDAKYPALDVATACGPQPSPPTKS